MIQQHRRPGIGHLTAEIPYILLGVGERQCNLLCTPGLIGLQCTAERDFPRIRVVHHFTEGAAKHRTRRAEGDVADELLPDQLIDVCKGFDFETSLLPERGDAVQPVADTAMHLAQADQFHAVVVHMARCLDGCPEAPGDPEQHVVGRQMLRDPLPGSQPVLNRQHQRRFTDDRGDTCGGITNARGFGGNDHQITNASSIRTVADIQTANGTITACTFDPQAVFTNDIQMLPPQVNNPDLVACLD